MTASLARLTIDLDALARRQAGAAEIAPVVKADAYGLGVAPIVRRLRAEGAERFFVARLDEGVALRRILGPEPTLYVFDGCAPGAAPRLMQASLTPVLNSLEQIGDWTATGGGDGALHIDTGMNRLGLRMEEAEALAHDPRRLGDLSVSLVISHLACASTPDHPMTQVQAEAFSQARRWFPNARASLANSGGLFQDPALAFDLGRPGVCLFGGGPFGEPDPRISPVATLEAPILQIRSVPAGESIGYGASFVAPHSLSVALIAAGYADGVLRSQSPAGYGWLRGARRRILGRISMDLIAIDVSDDPAARPGDMVELLGPNLLLDDVAQTGGTVAYEILTSLNRRVARQWRGAAG